MRAAAALVALFLAWPCAAEVVRGSGHAATEERKVSGFTQVGVAAPSQVELLQDGSEGLTVTADDNLLPKLETVVKDGVLHIRFRRGTEARPATPIQITLHARAIDRIGVAGHAKLEAPRLRGDHLRTDIAGSAQLVLPDLAFHDLSFHSAGHCHAMLAGKVDSLELHASGAGEFNAVRLEAREASASINGSAQAVLWVREKLSARVIGSGAVHYVGDPVLEKRVAGSGHVARLGAAPP
jgi:hypothetical protein